jgi:hypothetical protein
MMVRSNKTTCNGRTEVKDMYLNRYNCLANKQQVPDKVLNVNFINHDAIKEQTKAAQSVNGKCKET